MRNMGCDGFGACVGCNVIVARRRGVAVAAMDRASLDLENSSNRTELYRSTGATATPLRRRSTMDVIAVAGDHRCRIGHDRLDHLDELRVGVGHADAAQGHAQFGGLVL